MCDMKTQLAIADARDFCTIGYAAHRAGCSKRTVTRAIGAGLLEARPPLLGPGESQRTSKLLLAADVEQWITARKRVGK